MKRKWIAAIAGLGLLGCQQGQINMDDSVFACANKPNCVSTQETRDKHQVQPFKLSSNAKLSDIEAEALKLEGAKLIKTKEHYLQIECTSKIMRFVDDLELQLVEGELWVRSKSRVGYSDFGVNRKRVEQLRSLLKQANLIQ